jgi:NAD(P)-dependent dehydrogenase (short-subunit alcohol dehydrogenase family)
VSFTSKVALVTGGNKGIGNHIVSQLAQQGVQVYLASLPVLTEEMCWGVSVPGASASFGPAIDPVHRRGRKIAWCPADPRGS